MGFGFWVLGFGFWVLGFGFWVVGFVVLGLGFGVWGLGFGFRDSGLGFTHRMFTTIWYLRKARTASAIRVVLSVLLSAGRLIKSDNTDMLSPQV